MGELSLEGLLLGPGVLGLSTFDMLLPMWLGVTVLLNAERRTWGIWLAGVSLLIAGIFFAAHTAMIDASLLPFPGNPTLWFIGWSTLVLLPGFWYLTMLWFAGFWATPETPVRCRHRLLIWLAILLAAGSLIGVVPVEQIGGGAPARWLYAVPRSTIVRSPVATVIFPFYLLVVVVLSFDALRTIASTGRVSVDAARRQARPWLVATTALLLAVTLLASYALIRTTVGPFAGKLDAGGIRLLQWIDLVVVALLAIAVLMLARAIVSYEIFTGKTLPRRGLRRTLRDAILLCAGGGALLVAARYGPLTPTSAVMFGGVGLVLFYAVINWRSYRERERFLDQLRPTVTSAGDSGTTALGGDVRGSFDLLCTDVLEASRAAIVPLGTMAPLTSGPIVHPPGASAPVRLPSLAATAGDRQELSIMLEPSEHEGFLWCVPLWSQSGLSGALLLGEKVNGGLYTQEELEVARATAEQIVTLAASVDVARRLMDMQRRRIGERVMLDTQMRRALHDEVLPEIHSLALMLGAGQARPDITETLMSVHRRVSDILRSIPAGTPRALDELGLVGAIRHLVESEHRGAFDEVRWNVAADAPTVAGRLPREQAEVLYYAAQEAIRNAARYARGERHDRRIRLSVSIRTIDGLEVIVEDDGIGIHATSGGEAGSGQGLALHSTLMAVVGGSLSIEDRAGTRVSLRMP